MPNASMICYSTIHFPIVANVPLSLSAAFRARVSKSNKGIADESSTFIG